MLSIALFGFNLKTLELILKFLIQYIKKLKLGCFSTRLIFTAIEPHTVIYLKCEVNLFENQVLPVKSRLSVLDDLLVELMI